MTTTAYQKVEVLDGYLDKWQQTVDLMARLFQVPAGLIMRVWPTEIEVLIASRTPNNPYEPHEKASLNTGLYCETVMAQRTQLHVSNALEDVAWQDNPDVKLNMISYLGVPLVLPNGNVFGTICVLDEKTRHYSQDYVDLLWELRGVVENDFKIMQASQALADKNKLLEEGKIELEDALDNLKQAQNQLVHSEKMTLLGVLTAGIAHEINNPVNFITSSLNGLELIFQDIAEVMARYEQLDPKTADELQEIEQFKQEIEFHEVFSGVQDLLANISEGSNRTAEIVTALRTFSRLDEGEQKMADIHQNIDSTLLLLHRHYTDKVTIKKEYGNIPPILCYPGKLNQAFMNILTNAIDAINNRANDSGVAQITIKTSLEEKDGVSLVAVEITDTGIGISPENQTRVFEPFFTTKPVGSGVGLGLSISLSIIESHSGSIEVKSTVNQGSTFIIYLPR